jgi:endonuclease/exonuclease/phosphatase family metal-dependent hydrolase
VRIAQLVELAQYLQNPLIRDEPVVIAGDFNFEPDSLEYAFMTKILGLSDGFKDFHSDHKCTHCRNNKYSMTSKSRWLDYIFYRSGTRHNLSVSDSRFIFAGNGHGPVVSDHYGLKTTFVLTEASSCSASLQPALGDAQLRLLEQIRQSLISGDFLEEAHQLSSLLSRH